MSALYRSLAIGLFVFAVTFVESTSSLQAQTDEEVNSARLKAIEYIRSKQNSDGSWEYPGHETGITSLCTMALIENGTALYDPAVDKGYRYVRKNVVDKKETYDAAL